MYKILFCLTSIHTESFYKTKYTNFRNNAYIFFVFFQAKALEGTIKESFHYLHYYFKNLHLNVHLHLKAYYIRFTYYGLKMLAYSNRFHLNKIKYLTPKKLHFMFN